MFLKTFLKIFLFTQCLIQLAAYNSQRLVQLFSDDKTLFAEETYYDCYDENMDNFEFSYPKMCDGSKPSEWHLEVKDVIKYHQENSSCTKKKKLLLVSEYFVIILFERKGGDIHTLTRFVDSNSKEIQDCSNEHSSMERFSDDYFINVDRRHYWEYDFKDSTSIDVYEIISANGNPYKITFDHVKYRIQIYFFNLPFRNILELKTNPNFFEKITLKSIYKGILEYNFPDAKSYTTSKDRIERYGMSTYRLMCRRHTESTPHMHIANETLNEKIREHFKRKDLIVKNVYSRGDKTIYDIKYCRKVAVRKLPNNNIDNVCFTRSPVITETNEKKFADDNNYLHNNSTVTNCSLLYDTEEEFNTSEYFNNLSFVVSIRNFMNDTFNEIKEFNISDYAPDIKQSIKNWVISCYDYLMANYKIEFIIFLSVAGTVLTIMLYFLLKRLFIIQAISFIFSILFTLLTVSTKSISFVISNLISCCDSGDQKNNDSSIGQKKQKISDNESTIRKNNDLEASKINNSRVDISEYSYSDDSDFDSYRS